MIKLLQTASQMARIKMNVVIKYDYIAIKYPCNNKKQNNK